MYDIRQKTVITAAVHTTALYCIVFIVLVKNKSNLFFRLCHHQFSKYTKNS